MRPDVLMSQLHGTLAILRATRNRRPKQIRIHPLDLAAIVRAKGGRPPERAKLLGVPAVIDCAVRRGHPEVDV